MTSSVTAQDKVTTQRATGGFALIDSLQRHGVRHIFGYPGGAILPIYDELYKAEQRGGISHILVRHEQGAAHAADGYARATGEVGVCFGTSGPGATNLVTGIATAAMDSIPMVVITGQVPRAAIGTDAFQETDIFGITLPVVKHSYVVRSAGDMARIVAEARWMLAAYALALGSLLVSDLVLWLWVVPMLLGQPFLRLYLLAEHGRCPAVANMFENTRTTFTNRAVRFLAWNMPYHVEHHSLPQVPFHKLPELHGRMAGHHKVLSDGYREFTAEFVSELK